MSNDKPGASRNEVYAAAGWILAGLLAISAIIIALAIIGAGHLIGWW